jgi:hypothetical protein
VVPPGLQERERVIQGADVGLSWISSECSRVIAAWLLEGLTTRAVLAPSIPPAFSRMATRCPRGHHRGGRARFLPPYSPDFHPIELAFVKLKHS